jgi:hypothetical protein
MSAKLVLVALLAIASTRFFLTMPVTVQQRQAIEIGQHVHVMARVNHIGLATLGGVYLQATGSPTATVSQGVLGAIATMIDPLNPQGALYPLRKGMERLAGLMLLPLICLAIFHAVLTKAGDVEGELARIGTKFFVVLIMLWGYPLWDRLIFGLSSRVTAVLTSPAMVQAVMTQYDAQFKTSLSTGAQIDPTATLGSFYQHDLACQAEIGASNGTADSNAAQDCQGANIPEPVAAMNTASIRSNAAGTSSDQIEYLCGKVSPEILQRIAKNANDPTWYEKAQACYQTAKASVSADLQSVANAPSTIKSYVMDQVTTFFTNTIVGWLVTLETIFATVALWFVWLGVIVARAFSLSLAPLALVTGLLPKKDNDGSWFLGHAKIVLKPLGIAFALLVMMTVQVGMLATPVLGQGVIVGLGVKFAMFVMLILAMYKSAKMMDKTGFDVTKVASEIGSNVQHRAVAVAGSAVKGTAKGVGRGAAAAMTAGGSEAARAGMNKVRGLAGGVGGGNSNRATETAAALGGAAGGAGGMAASGMGGKFDLGATGPKKPGRLATLAQKGAKELVKSPFAVGKFAWQNRVKTADVESMGGLKAAIGTPLAEAGTDFKQQYESRAKARGNRSAAPVADDVQGALNRGQQLKTEVAEVESKFKRRVEPKATDMGHTIDISDIRATSDNPVDNAASSALANKLIAGLVSKGIPVDMEYKMINGEKVLQLSQGTIQAVYEAAAKDKDFAKYFESTGTDVWGSELGGLMSTLPRVTASGQRVGAKDKDGHDIGVADGETVLVDMNALIARSTEVADGFAMAAQYGTKREEDALRRTAAAAFGGGAEGSIKEMVLRNLPPEINARRKDDNDEFESEEAYVARLTTEAQRVMRMAWYEQASAAERHGVGAPADAPLHAIADFTGADAKIIELKWAAKGSLTTDTLHVVPLVEAAINAEQQQMQALNNQWSLDTKGTIVGLDVQHYLASKRTETRYHFQPGSVFDHVAQEEVRRVPVAGSGMEMPTLEDIRSSAAAGDFDQRVFERVRDQILSEPGLKAQIGVQQGGETDEAFIARNRDAFNRLAFGTPSQ